MCPGCGYRSGWGADPADADRHVEACPDVPIECANPGCGAKVPRRLAPEHQSSCPKRIVTCPFSLCTHQCTADTLKCHTDASQEEHHNLAAAALSDLRQELTAQLQEAEALQRERMAAACSQVVRILVGTEETGLPPAPLPTECKPASKTTESGTKYMSAPFVFSGVRFTLMAKFDDVRDTYAVFIRLGPGGRHAWAEVKWSFCFVNPLAGGGTRREQRALLANDEKGVGFLTIANKAQVLDPAEGFLEEIKGLKYLVFRVSMYVKDAVLEVDARGDTRRTKTLKDEAEWPEAPF
ncbi:hypothetical protein DFJ74DRAFT_670651 [Hyaloraphidium curvatum]|nr:hypothetical protein DFJ74DRAFT_670651 [Hyaloraphidium curvatum]